jgi:hypothetical protein
MSTSAAQAAMKNWFSIGVSSTSIPERCGKCHSSRVSAG